MAGVADTLSWWLSGAISIALSASLGVWLLTPAWPAASAPAWARSCLALLAGAFVAYLPAVSLALTDAPPAELLPAVWLVLLHTHNGAMWLLGAAGLVIAGAASFMRAAAKPGGPGAWPRRATAAGLLLFLIAKAATGHAAEHGMFSASACIHAIHIGAGCAWAGSVAVSWRLLLRWTGTPASWPAVLMLRLSQVAATALTLVVVSGLFNVWRLLDAAAGRFGTYEQLLAAKLILVGCAAALGAWNRWHALPRLLGGDEGVRKPLMRSLCAETTLLALVVLMAARLASTMPSM